jgi:hypothetical protein
MKKNFALGIFIKFFRENVFCAHVENAQKKFQIKNFFPVPETRTGTQIP